MAELAASIGAERLDLHLQTLTEHIAALLTVLRDPDDPRAEIRAELAHTVAGDAGQLGFTALSVAARRFMEAMNREEARIPASAAALIEAAVQVEDLVHQRLFSSCSARMASAKLM